MSSGFKVSPSDLNNLATNIQQHIGDFAPGGQSSAVVQPDASTSFCGGSLITGSSDLANAIATSVKNINQTLQDLYQSLAQTSQFLQNAAGYYAGLDGNIASSFKANGS